jgi:hypothetical protein
MASRTSSRVSPRPTMMELLVYTSGRVALAWREHREGALQRAPRVAHRALQPVDGLDVVREHVGPPSTTGGDVAQVALRIPEQGLDEDLRAVRADGPSVSATWAAPPSSMSSRSTMVITT